MPGIDDEDVRRVREANDIVSVFQDRVPLRQRGGDFWCCCPFHDEKTPSCHVDPRTQQWYCFGCGEGGDVFSFVMKMEDISFPDAVRRLADRAGVQIKEAEGHGVARSYKARLKEVCAATADFYHTQLMRGKSEGAAAARAYLAGRGLGGQVPGTWMLGFAPGHGELVRHLRQKGFTAKEMADANVAVARNGRVNDRFFDRVMFPILDDGGEVIAFGGRVIGKGEPKYLNTGDTPIFHKSNVLFGMDKAKAYLTTAHEAIVVEGYTDVIAMHEAGIKNTVATLGTALTRSHLRLISRHVGTRAGGGRVVYLFDGDAAGQRAADRALKFIDDSMTPEAGTRRMTVCACTLPDDLDPADYLAKYSAERIREEFKQAKPLVEYGIDRRIAAFDTSTAEGRTAACAQALSVLAPIKDSLLAKDYAVQIAGRLQLREDGVLEQLASLKRPKAYDEDAARRDSAEGHPPTQQPPLRLTEQERSRRRYEGLFIGICARDPRIGVAQADALAQTAWHDPLCAQVADTLLSLLSAGQAMTAADVAGTVTTRHPQAARMLVAQPSNAQDPASFAAYLAEELAIGDMEDAIGTYKARLKSPGDMTQEDYDLLFETTTAMQKGLAARRLAHDKAQM